MKRRNQTKITEVGFIILFSLLTLTLGCGQVVTGSFVGTETVTVKNATGTVSQSITISLTQTNNDVIAGNSTSDRGRGDIQARPSGAMSNGPYTLLTSYNALSVPSGGISCGIYTGQGTITAEQISVTLELTQPATIPTPLPAGYPAITAIQDICPTKRVINATKQ